MPRSPSRSELTVSELEKLLSRRKSELDRLHKERGRLQKQLEQVDLKIQRLDGRANGFPSGSRAKNSKSLIDVLTHVLGAVARPLTVSEILEAVLEAGYRSTSAKFRGIVNQTLIKERRRFVKTARGMYQLKK